MDRAKVTEAVRTLREMIAEKETTAGVYGAPDPTPDRKREAINTLIRELELADDLQLYDV